MGTWLYLALDMLRFLPLLLKLIIPRYSDFRVLRLYGYVDFVVLDGAVRHLSIQALHIASDHGHLLAYTHDFTVKSYLCTNRHRLQVRDVERSCHSSHEFPGSRTR
jgi:hypothetical protein